MSRGVLAWSWHYKTSLWLCRVCLAGPEQEANGALEGRKCELLGDQPEKRQGRLENNWKGGQLPTV